MHFIKKVKKVEPYTLGLVAWKLFELLLLGDGDMGTLVVWLELCRICTICTLSKSWQSLLLLVVLYFIVLLASFINASSNSDPLASLSWCSTIEEIALIFNLRLNIIFWVFLIPSSDLWDTFLTARPNLVKTLLMPSFVFALKLDRRLPIGEWSVFEMKLALESLLELWVKCSSSSGFSGSILSFSE